MQDISCSTDGCARFVKGAGLFARPVGHFSGSIFLQNLFPTLSYLKDSLLKPLQDLRSERDPDLFFSQIFNFAIKLKQTGYEAAAGSIFQALIETSGNEKVIAAAKKEFQGMAGQGALASRLEFLVNRFVHDATDYKMILPMLGASLAAQAVGAWALGRLVRTPGARFVAGSLGYAVEVPALTALSRALQPDADTPLADDLKRSALLLGSLRIFSRVPVKHLSSFLGIWSAYEIQEQLGLRPRLPGAIQITDILSSMVSLGIGANLANRVLAGKPGTMVQEWFLRANEARNHSALTKFLGAGTGLAAFFTSKGAHAATQLSTAGPAVNLGAGMLALSGIGWLWAMAGRRNTNVKIDRERRDESLDQVLKDLKKSGRKVTLKELCMMMQEVYCRGLPEVASPRWPSFLAQFGKKAGVRKDSELFQKVSSADVLHSRERAGWNEDRIYVRVDLVLQAWAFGQAVDALKALEQRLPLHQLTERAFQIYLGALGDKQGPSLATFSYSVSGSSADSKLRHFLAASGVVEMSTPKKPGGRKKYILVDTQKRNQAFAQAIRSLQISGETASHGEVARMAFANYTAGMDDIQKPALASFISYIIGNQKVPEIVKMLVDSGVVTVGGAAYRGEARKHIFVDPQKRNAAYRHVIQQLKNLGQKLSLSGISQAAYEVYIQGLGIDERPSLAGFSLGKKSNDRDLIEAISAAGIESSPAPFTKSLIPGVPLDIGKKDRSFAQALQELEIAGQRRPAALIADLAYDYYVAGMRETERPSRESFLKMAVGPAQDPKVMELLKYSWAAKDPMKPFGQEELRAFQRAIRTMQKKKVQASLEDIATFAAEIYSRKYPEKRKVIEESFVDYVVGPYAQQRILKSIQQTGVLLSDTAWNKDVIENCISKLILILKKTGQKLPLRRLAGLVFDLYAEEIPSTRSHQREQFQDQILGDGYLEIKKVLEDSDVVLKASPE